MAAILSSLHQSLLFAPASKLVIAINAFSATSLAARI
jgi:hypothetical protein